MAKIRDYNTNEDTADVNTHSCALCNFEIDDLLLWFVTKDTTTGGNLTTPSGWTEYTFGGSGFVNNGGHRSHLFFKIAVSGEADPETTSTDVDAFHSILIAIEDADTATPIGTGSTAVTNTATAFRRQAPALTTSGTNRLIIYFCSADGSTQDPTSEPGVMFGLGQDASSVAAGFAWSFVPGNGGAAARPYFYILTADDTQLCSLEIIDDGSHNFPGYVDPATVPATIIDPMIGTSLTYAGGGSHPATLSLQFIGGEAFSQVWIYDASLTSWTDATAALNNATTGDVTLQGAIDDILYLAAANQFDHVIIDVGTAGITGNGFWEYYDGSSWTAFGLTRNNYNRLLNASYQSINWTIPGDWTANTVNASGPYYYIRYRITVAYTVIPILDQGHAGGRFTFYDAPASTADFGINPYHSALGMSPAVSGGLPRTIMGGSERLYTTPLDLDNLKILSSVIVANPRDLIDLGKLAPPDAGLEGGLFVVLLDSGGDYRVFQYAGLNSIPNPVDRMLFLIDFDQTTTAWYDTGAFDITDVSSILYFEVGARGALNFYISQFVSINQTVLVGGSTEYPVDMAGLITVLNSYCLPFCSYDGAALVSYTPIQIGGGDAVICDLNATAIQFPALYNLTNRTVNVQVAEEWFEISYYGQSGDTIKHRNSVVSSPNYYKWTIHASASDQATYDFSGLTVVNAVVTLRDVTTFTGMTFVECKTIDASGCSLDSCVLTGWASGTNDRLAINSSTTINGTRINVSTLSDGEYLTTGSPEVFSTCNFIGGGGHALRITSTGTYSFSGNLFSGFGPAEISFHTQNDVDAVNDEIDATGHGYTTGDAVYYQDQSGTDTIGLTDSTLYYVAAVTIDSLAFYPTLADALTDTNQINLSDGSTGETHYLYSAKAALYNASGGLVTINITDNGDTPTIRNSDGSSTTVNNAVALEVNGVIQNTQCYIAPSAGGSALMNEAATTLVSGNEYKATESYNYTGSTAVTIRAREMGYLPFETTGTINSAGLTVTAVWQVDPNWKLEVSGINITFTNATSLITRASGDFGTDGWLSVMGQVTVDGSGSNDGTYTISAVGTTTVTVSGASLTDEGPVAGVTLTYARRTLT